MDDEQKDGDDPCCYFHPREVVVGVCACCLHERLLVLASKRGTVITEDGGGGGQVSHLIKSLAKKSSVALPKVFALSSSLYRSDSRRQKESYYSDDEDSIASLEDSFISIKFEDNGWPSWDKKHPALQPKQTAGQNILSANSKGGGGGGGGGRSVVEHSKPKTALKWRKKVGQLFQRWKGAGKGTSSSSSSHGGLAACKADASKGRTGWIRSLTRRRPVGV